jgi:PEGA domain-containing protein/tetratricopeptide repeat protein
VKAQVGDKVAWIPPDTAATMDGMVTFTVKAGKEGVEKTMSDVTIYRNGVWVGTTSATGELKVPVPTGQKVAFIFVRGGIPAHVETLKIERGQDRLSVLMPAALTRLRIDSDPAGARVSIDGEEMGVTPMETDVFMGFHRVKVDAGGDFRAYDKVLELASLEEALTGSKKVVLLKDVLKDSEMRMARGDVDGAIAVLERVDKDHPDFSQAHHRLAGLYLDEKKDAERAIQEFETVLSLPENRELVNKKFAVTFLNLGRAYYLSKGYDKAIAELTIARDNKRFFPREAHDRATHDTLYYLALSSHKLYHAQRSERVLQETAARWKDYFDFFPESLRDDDEVKTARAGSEQFYEEIKRKLGGE